MSEESMSVVPVILVCLFFIIFVVMTIIGMWKVFAKAGVTPWFSLIPFLNLFCLWKISGFTSGISILMMILSCIPYISGIMGIILCVKLAQSFNKGVGFILGLIFFAPIFIIILGFGSSQYGLVNNELSE